MMPGTIWLKAAACAALVLALLFAVRGIDARGYDRATAQAQAQITQSKADAAAALLQETERANAATKALQTLVDQQNQKDTQHAQTLNDLGSRLRAAAGPNQRLRDPHAIAGCGPSGDSPTGATATAAGPGATDRAETGGLLSEPLTELLQTLAADADTINTAYASCRAYASAVTVPP